MRHAHSSMPAGARRGTLPHHLWPPKREVGIVAQDPSVLRNGKMVRSRIWIPLEDLDAGPRGGRVAVIDYDATARKRYAPPPASWIPNADAFTKMSDDEILSNPWLHCWNAYAIVMRTLGRFEHALGRRIGWGFSGHQLWVAPHAFADANAFYSEEEGALYFGYVPGKRRGDSLLRPTLS